MKNKDALFQLIKSLNINEKRYFSLFAARHTIGDKNNYLKLFEVMDRQKEYDEKKLVVHFAGTSIGKNLRVNRHYLYKLILKSMRMFRSETSVEMKLKGMLDDIEFLFSKELYRQCEKLILQAKTLALKYENNWFLSEFIRLELNLFRAQSYLSKNEKDIADSNKKLTNYIGRYQNTNEYQQLSDELFFKIKKKWKTRTVPETEISKNIYEHPLLTNEKKALSTEALFHYYTIHAANCTYEKDDYKGAYRYIRKALALLEKNRWLIETKLERYITVLHNAVICQLQLKDYGNIQHDIEKLKNISVQSQLLQHQLFHSVTILELNFYLDTCQFEKGLALIQLLQDKTYNPETMSAHRYVDLVYQIALICFITGNYNKAKIYLHRILNDTAYDVRNDLHCFAWILQLIVHYELGDIDFVGYRVKSTRQFLAKRERLYRFEKILIDFFRNQTTKTQSEESQIQIFKKLKNQFDEIIKNPFERKVLDYFDFISWTESKIEKKPLAEVMKNKRRQTTNDKS